MTWSNKCGAFALSLHWAINSSRTTERSAVHFDSTATRFADEKRWTWDKWNEQPKTLSARAVSIWTGQTLKFLFAMLCFNFSWDIAKEVPSAKWPRHGAKTCCFGTSHPACRSKRGWLVAVLPLNSGPDVSLLLSFHFVAVLWKSIYLFVHLLKLWLWQSQ